MLKIRYKTSVYTQAGFRSETFTALADRVSDKRVRVVEIVDVGGHGTTGTGTITGAKRQSYNVKFVANCEIGKIKRLSACEILTQE